MLKEIFRVLKQLIYSYIDSISNKINDLAAPLLESLYLILYGIDKLSVQSYNILEFPIPLE